MFLARITRTVIAVACALTVVTFFPAKAFAQAASSQPAGSVTLVGCLVTESDYRRAHDLGQVTGSRLNDYVLVNSTVVTSASQPAARSATPCTETPGGTAYRIAGSREAELQSLVGHRVAVTGTYLDDPLRASAAPRLPVEFAMTAFRDASSAAPASAAAAPAATPAPAAAAPPRAASAPAAANSGAQASGATSASGRQQLPQTSTSNTTIALVGLIVLAAGIRLMRGKLS